MKSGNVFWTLVLTVTGTIGIISLLNTSPSEPNPPEAVTAEPVMVGGATIYNTSALSEAQKRAGFVERIEAVLDSLDINLRCSWVDHSQCAVFIDRVKGSPELHSVLHLAKRMSVRVHLDDEFSVGNGSVHIDNFATDDEIIKFLTGKAP